MPMQIEVSNSSRQNTHHGYMPLGILEGHAGEVNCLAVSQDGSLLASGGQYNANIARTSTYPCLAGSDGPKLWDLLEFKKIDTPRIQGIGPVTAMVWTTNPDNEWESVCFGTATGLIMIWRETPQVRVAVQYVRDS